MPRNHPAEPDYREPGFGAEKRVWDALQALPAEACVHLLQAHVAAASARLAGLAVATGFRGSVVTAASALPKELMAAIAAASTGMVCSTAPVR